MILKKLGFLFFFLLPAILFCRFHFIHLIFQGKDIAPHYTALLDSLARICYTTQDVPVSALLLYEEGIIGRG